MLACLVEELPFDQIGDAYLLDFVGPPSFVEQLSPKVDGVEELPFDQIGDAYLLDFVGPPSFVQQLSPKVDGVIILDYHKTALKMLDEGEFSSENVTKLLYLDVEHVINQAMSSLSHKQTLINEVLDQSYEIVLNDEASGHSLAVDGDDVSDLRSELGNQLAEKSRNQT
ncbi:hypothetical protein Tco_1176455 [Tanacetum coccineum]